MRLMILLLATTLWCADVPYGVMSGILAKESRSYYGPNDRIIWVDRRIGTSGERSAYQVTPAAFKQVHLTGERFASMLASDQHFAEQISMRYLLWLYKHAAKGSWYRAVGMYNGGPGNMNSRYANEVFRLATKSGNTIQ